MSKAAKGFRFSTLKQRIIVLLTSGTLICAVMISAVSYNAISSMQQNKIRSSMEFNLDQLSTKLTQDYSNLAQITQQMTPQGTVGDLVSSYFEAKDPYDRSVLSRNISRSLGLQSFSNPDLEFMMYYQQKNKNILFPDFSLRDDFNLSKMPNLHETSEMAFQSIHESMCRFSSDQVISISRNIVFSNGEHWIIYVEQKANIVSDIEKMYSEGNMHYTLLLLDQNSRTVYSSEPKYYPTGKTSVFKGTSGSTNRYVWNQKVSGYGYKVVLLLPMESYNRELNVWKSNMFVTLGLIIIVMAFISAMLWKLIYRPLNVFEKEMAAFGHGNMDALQYHVGVEEFDQLFDQFNRTKQELQQMMQNIKQKEKLRHHLEMERLSYQINPHFLMNALNSVHWLAMMNGQRDIDKVISTLNSLLSYNLGKSGRKATLRVEIEMLEAYLSMQKMRYDFCSELDVEEGDYLDKPVARFILQPIAENAVSHGLDEGGKITVKIRAFKDRNLMEVVIRDNGKGMDRETLEKISQPEDPDKTGMQSGIGLRYVRFMLESFYGDQAEMLITSELNHGTTVTLHLPIELHLPVERKENSDPSIDSGR